MPRDQWRKVRNTTISRRSRQELANGSNLSFIPVWDDGTICTRAEGNSNRDGTLDLFQPLPDALPLAVQIENCITHWKAGLRRSARAFRYLETLAKDEPAATMYLLQLLEKNASPADVGLLRLIARSGPNAARAIIDRYIGKPASRPWLKERLSEMGAHGVQTIVEQVVKVADLVAASYDERRECHTLSAQALNKDVEMRVHMQRFDLLMQILKAAMGEHRFVRRTLIKLTVPEYPPFVRTRAESLLIQLPTFKKIEPKRKKNSRKPK